MQNRPESVSDYLTSFPPAIRKRLDTVRRIIREVAPKAKETISYGMPAYKYEGMLAYFAGYPNHIGLYALPSAQQAFSKELSNYKTGKGSVQFPHDRPLPVALIRNIIRFRVSENEQKAQIKTKRHAKP